MEARRGYISENIVKRVHQMDTPSWTEVECPLTSQNTVDDFVFMAKEEDNMRIGPKALEFMNQIGSISDRKLTFLDDDGPLPTWSAVWMSIIEHLVPPDLALEMSIFSIHDVPAPSAVGSIDANERMFLSYVSDERGLRPVLIRETQAVGSVDINVIETTKSTVLDHGWTRETIKKEIHARVEKGPFDFVFQSALTPKPNHEKLTVSELPGLYNTELKEHQVESLNFAYAKNGRAIISLFPGAGKTLDGCVFMKSYRDTSAAGKRMLVVCPNSVVDNWQKEYIKWCTTYFTSNEKEMNKLRKQLKDRERLDVVSYESVLTLAGCIKGDPLSTIKTKVNAWVKNYCVAVFDECHKLKSTKTLRSNVIVPAVAKIPHVLLLSGTPMPNRPNELYNLLRVVDPQSFTEERRILFEERYCGGYSVSETEYENRGASFETELNALMSLYMYKNVLSSSTPFELIRTRLRCAPSELSIDNTLYFMTKMQEHRRLAGNYHTAKTAEARSIAKSLLDQHILNQYQMIGYFKVMTMIEDYRHNPQSAFRMKPNERAVFFFHHVDYAKMFYDEVNQTEPGSVCMLTGASTKDEREKTVAEFSLNPLSTLRYGMFTTNAMGEGINLVPLVTKAFIVEMEFRPSSSIQAEKRIHRMGSVGTAYTYWLYVDLREETKKAMEKSKSDLVLEIKDIEKQMKEPQTTKEEEKELKKEKTRLDNKLKKQEGGPKDKDACSMDEWIFRRLNEKLATNFRLMGGSIPKEITFSRDDVDVESHTETHPMKEYEAYVMTVRNTKKVKPMAMPEEAEEEEEDNLEKEEENLEEE